MQYREVIPEVSQDVEGHKRAPDYVFRVGRDPVFFVEAKKPGVQIKNASDSAYQLRRYAWNAKLALSILTDFEELAVYECLKRPSEKDKVSAGRIKIVNYDEYIDHLQEIWDIFSRDAVWSGSFDQFTQSARGKRGTSEVDSEFLKEIEGWRDELAKGHKTCAQKKLKILTYLLDKAYLVSYDSKLNPATATLMRFTLIFFLKVYLRLGMDLEK